MLFYRSNLKSSSEANYDSFYITINDNKYLPCADFVHTTFPNNYYTFNDAIIVGDNVAECTNLVRDISNFNNEVTFGENTKCLNNAFSNCSNFNQPITLKRNTSYTSGMFNCGNSFNSPVIFDCEGLHYCSYMFNNCSNFNQPLNITLNTDYNTIYMYNMFMYCYNLNSYISINNGKNLVCDYMFYGCNNLNQPLNFGSCEIISAESMFRFDNSLNSIITLGVNTAINNVKLNNIFYWCNNMNSVVNIIDKGYNEEIGYQHMLNINGLFCGCSNFNIVYNILPKSITLFTNAFASCSNFNQPLAFDDYPYLSSVAGLVSNCPNFNSIISFNNCPNISGYSNLFWNCLNYNQPFIAPNGGWFGNMLYNCLNFGSTIYVGGNNTSSFTNLFRGTNSQKRKTLYINNAYQDMCRYETARSSMVGAAITWTDITNGFYNAAYNIYCYYNYNA